MISVLLLTHTVRIKDNLRYHLGKVQHIIVIFVKIILALNVNVSAWHL